MKIKGRASKMNPDRKTAGASAQKQHSEHKNAALTDRNGAPQLY